MSSRKGSWRPVQGPEGASAPPPAPEAGGRESDWYQPIANLLVKGGQVCQPGCTRAIVCGGKLNGPQWTNPDVVGWIEPDSSAKVLNFPTRLVAVEIKRASDQASLLTGFAEACAYLDFAHFSWLIVPWCEGLGVERVGRLCKIHGLGLAYVCTDDESAEKIWLEVAVPPRCHEPDAREFAEFLDHLKTAESQAPRRITRRKQSKRRGHSARTSP